MTSLEKSAQNLYCYVDESGEPGRNTTSNKFFIVNMIMITGLDNVLLYTKMVDNLKSYLGLPKDFEFHFTHNDYRLRDRFIDEIAKMDFKYITIAIKKDSNLATCSHMATKLIDAMPKTNNKVFITLDENPILLKEIKKAIKGKYKKYKCAEGRSTNNNLLQVADYVTAISKRKVLNEKNGSVYYNRLRKREYLTRVVQ